MNNVMEFNIWLGLTASLLASEMILIEPIPGPRQIKPKSKSIDRLK